MATLPELYNFKTGTHDIVEGGYASLTDDAAESYIPQHPAIQGYFRARRALGDSIEEAIVAVAEAVLNAMSRDTHDVQQKEITHE